MGAALVLSHPFQAAEPNPPPARQNPILREYFEKQYMTLDTIKDNDRFMQDYIDRKIDYLLKQINERMAAVKSSFEEVGKAREETTPARHEGGSQEAGQRLKAALKTLADQAESLRKMLSLMLVDLKSEVAFKPRLPAEAGRNRFENEIRFLAEQIEKAEQGIDDYFFQPNNVVQLEELKGENMMVFLYRVREMARRLRAEL